jgi:hypothetical protein
MSMSGAPAGGKQPAIPLPQRNPAGYTLDELRKL